MTQWVRKRLLAWYDEHGRDFAWRHTTDPYQVLLAEMMVQRTRAEQAEKVWKDFIAMFPIPGSTVGVSDAALLGILKPLGLEWRATNIVKAMREFEADPTGATDNLPGVSHYAAAALRCFAYGERIGIVDSNVVRVYARFLGFLATDGTRRSLSFHRLASAMTPRLHSKEYNWALLDLGATICRPRHPLCSQCPLSERCVYADSLPSSSAAVRAS